MPPTARSAARLGKPPSGRTATMAHEHMVWMCPYMVRLCPYGINNPHWLRPALAAPRDAVLEPLPRAVHGRGLDGGRGRGVALASRYLVAYRHERHRVDAVHPEVEDANPLVGVQRLLHD